MKGSDEGDREVCTDILICVDGFGELLVIGTKQNNDFVYALIQYRPDG